MLAAIVPKSNTVAMISQMLNVPFMMLGGLFMPLSRFEDVPVLPQLGSLLPSGIAVNVLRPTFISEPFKSIPDVQGILLLPVWVSLAVLLGYLFLSIFVAARFFKWEV
jgi:ABC-type multidrug transport system permease subunit